MVTGRKDKDPEPSDGANARALQPGYRAYLVKDGDKYVITLPVAEYDPEAPSLTAGQIDGIHQVAELYGNSLPASPMPAKRIRYDPFLAAQNTGPKKGGGPAFNISTGSDDTDL